MKFCEHMSQLADVFLVGAGSPCQDLSALKAFRLGLGGSQSALFYEVPRIIKLLQKYDRQPVEFFLENVFLCHQIKFLNSTKRSESGHV